MANEYLTRTPTSSGNTKVFTISTWVKLSKESQTLMCNATASGANNGFYFSFTSNTIYIGTWTTSWQWFVQSTAVFRDRSSWFHVTASVNTTQVAASDRVSIYVNGTKITDFTSATYPTLNYDTLANDNKLHAIGRWGSYSGGYYNGQYSDYFFVDGQALTPDVFGFYKDGDGYISVGSTQATDFRPGQWMPHSPTKIKKDINRRGGFGVNGFYLPMNDSSNPGADFHCAPNSIIKLKGEDLPQPQNGAPETSDAFVSQLREEKEGTLGFDGVVKFDGSDDYLEIPHSDDFDFGSGDFTVEAFIEGARGGGSTGSVVLNQSNGSAASDSAFYFGAGTTGVSLYLTTGTSWTNYITTDANVSNSGWHHVVWQRRSNTAEIYVDGRLAQTGSFTGTINNSSRAVEVGRQSTDGSYFNGMISNLRVVKGSAVYTANFTPPTEPLTNVTNTKLLCCQSITQPGSATVAPNVSGVNNGTQWSEYLTGGGGFQGSYPVTNAFDGVTTGANTSRSVDSQTTQTFTPPGGISYSSSVEVWTWMDGSVSLNGGSNITVSNDQSFRQIASGSGTINSIDFNSASGNNVYIAGIRVDGTILVDPLIANGDVFATKNELTGSTVLAVPAAVRADVLIADMGGGNIIRILRNCR